MHLCGASAMSLPPGSGQQPVELRGGAAADAVVAEYTRTGWLWPAREAMDLKSELKACGVDLEPEEFIALILEVIDGQKRVLRSRSSGPLTDEERAAYEAGGFDLEKRWQGADSPFVRSLAELGAIMADALTVKAAADLLSLQQATVRRRLAQQVLYGFRVGGRWLLPGFQFVDGRVIPDLGCILRDMDRPSNPLTVCRFFLRPREDLADQEGGQPQSPRDWLLSGRPAEPLREIVRQRVLL